MLTRCSILTRTLVLTFGLLCAIYTWPKLVWAGGGYPPAEKPQKQMLHQIAQQANPEASPKPQVAPPVPQPARAQATTSDSQDIWLEMKKPGKLELGVIGGEPLGVSAKYWLTPTRAIDAGLGWTLIGEDTNMQLHADYLFHNFNTVKVNQGSLPLYYGLGARVRFGEDTRFGVRVPMGVQYISSGKTFSLFAEVAPIISFIPDAEVDLNVGLGVRFFFFQ